jgi:hypothetical protein
MMVPGAMSISAKTPLPRPGDSRMAISVPSVSGKRKGGGLNIGDGGGGTAGQETPFFTGGVADEDRAEIERFAIPEGGFENEPAGKECISNTRELCQLSLDHGLHIEIDVVKDLRCRQPESKKPEVLVMFG